MKIWSDPGSNVRQPGDPAVRELASSGEQLLGVYNGVILHEDARVTQGYNPGTLAAITTVRRNVFCGAQAGMVGFGRDNSINRFTWVEELFDFVTANDNDACHSVAA